MADAHARPGGIPGEDLGLQQGLEKLLVGPLLGTRALCGHAQAIQHARRFEFRQQVRQALPGMGLLAHAQSAA